MTVAHHLPPAVPAAQEDLPGWPPERVWGLAPEVAVALGCHRQTVYKMARAGLLPARPHGLHGWRFHRDDVLRLLRSQGAAAEAPAPLATVDELLVAASRLRPEERLQLCPGWRRPGWQGQHGQILRPKGRSLSLGVDATPPEKGSSGG
jgi:excisionase family DNA binding protein